MAYSPGLSCCGLTQKLRILIVGSGGREHALAWKLEQSDIVDKIFVAPGEFTLSVDLSGGLSCPHSNLSKVNLRWAPLGSGNGGTTFGNKVESLAIKQEDFAGLVQFAVENNVSSGAQLGRFGRAAGLTTALT